MLLKEDDQALDPRVKRTRQLLVDAMKGLLHEQDLQSITVAEITQAAEVNRATFYAHFTDKYALFDYLVRQSFQDTLRQRLSDSEGFCLDDLQALVLAVFEYMGQMDIHCLPGDMQIRQLAAQQIQSQLQEMILDGINTAEIEEKPPQVFASLMSWAIFGAAFEWSKSRPRPPVEEIAGQVVQLITEPLRSRQARNFSGTVRAR